MKGRRLLRAIAHLLIPERAREFVVGDLEELHAVRARHAGPWRAWVRTLRDLLGSAITVRTARRRAPELPRATRPETAVLHDLLLDVRAAARSLVRERGFATATVLTLALGIGPTAAVFAMVNQLVLRPLPGVTDPGGAAYLHFRSREDPESIQGHGIATLDFDALRKAATFVDGVGSYGYSTYHVSTGEGRPLMVHANTVYGDYFEVLGVRPSEGRLLSADDTRFGADPLVAVIGEELRARLFGPGAEATGRTIQVNDRSVRVVGVTSGGFHGAERSSDRQMWVPYPSLAALTGFTEERLLDRNSVMHDDLVVRLRSDPSVETVEDRLAAILAEIGEAVPEHHEYLAGLRPMLFPGLTTPPMWRAMTHRTLSILGVIVGLVLLVACANVANLLFRNVNRRGSAAVRRALGASSGRIARSELAQSFVLASLGSVIGLAVAWLISLPLRGESLLRPLPELDQFAVDARVLTFAVAASVATTILFGTVPAMLAGRFDLGGALREAGRGATGHAAYLRSLMAASQIGLSLALLVGGVMLTRTVSNLYAVDTGMTEENVAVLHVDVPGDNGAEQELVARETALASLEAVPGVRGVAATLYGPHGSRMMGRVGRDARSDGSVRSEVVPVTAGWFELLEVTTEEGARLRLDEDAWHPGAAVLSASLARKLFGSESAALGQPVSVRFAAWEETRVVAVTSDLRRASSPDESADAVFVPFEASPLPFVTFLVKAASVDVPVLEAIRGAVELALPDVPVPDPVALTAVVDQIHSERRIFSTLLQLLSVFAVTLSAVGLYGVIAFAVAGRRREFGVRIALGAEASRIAALVARYAARIIVAGTALGLGGAYALARVLESRLFGLEPVDAVSYGLAIALFAVTAAGACWVPTRRATRVDPVLALKAE
jgi:putative ABC transport system permease protein